MAEPKYISTQDGYALLVTQGSGGDGPAEVTISGSVAVTGPVTEGELTAVVGLLSAGAYSDDTGAADGSVIGLLKGIYVQNSQIITLLTAIEANTSGA